MLDVFLTSHSERIINSGVIHLGLSDHSLIYSIRKINSYSDKKPVRIVHYRDFRSFSSMDFIHYLKLQPWQRLRYSKDSESTWLAWKEMFLTIVDKHAPLKRRRVKYRSMPWVDRSIRKLMYERDRMKRKFVVSNG